MKLELTCDGPQADGEVTVRLIVLNDSYEPVAIDRRLLFGPHPAVSDPPLLSSEPSSTDPAHDRIVLNPWGLYGRERHFQYASGAVTFHGYLLRRATERLLPAGPGDGGALLADAPPLVVRFGGPE